MARRQVPVVGINRFALTPDTAATAGDATNGMFMLNDGATFIQMVSTSGSTQTVNVTVPAGADVNLTVGPRAYTLTANAKGKTGFFPIGAYGSVLLFSTTSALVSFTAYTFAD